MKILILAASLLFSFVCQTFAATISLANWNGHEIISFEGPIEQGDADKIAEVLPRAVDMPYGTPVVLLNSPGGSVAEALKISKIFDASPVHTVIPKGAKCASACASIVFIAGKYRTMEDGAAFGQHSCSINDRKFETCNEIISQHAVLHGVSHGSVAAFVTYTDPSDILWFSRADTEGWGITRYPGEDMSGFEKSEPRALKLILGKEPPAQSKWRINFKKDGFEAFVRTVSDYEREMQLNLFCVEALKGRLFVGMEISGPEQAVKDSVLGAIIWTDVTKWQSPNPIIHQVDENMTELFIEVPKNEIKNLLTKTTLLQFGVLLRKPYEPMVARTWLDSSRKVLLFAANNCVKE
ncbi:periplasmic protein-like protein [Brucella anthropi]|uniref:Periplasmic protein-like protein n=1 Tax=Brucella anthropi (strain ATCC 49188 / DSM 6882 / CCUG 24695 / JCM 21032 / LMG 3331 / NBRC 15819 / NCTC 12168 / Alc 37) TaxID=439375 RepID=A6X012_BRUA4|nr:periplasmic protein-like protein [Brucella anthropi]ABS14566.1 periplasmic protein-like protein [Brucella anthropi ATCC 49188]AIK45318.1 putative periplasmic -like protein [Brucella anthropi]SUA64449.1 Uncharacterised protein [Brucella anthropi]